MTTISVILFILSIIIAGLYLEPMIDDEDYEYDHMEFTPFDIVLLAAALIYIGWFVCTFARSFLD